MEGFVVLETLHRQTRTDIKAYPLKEEEHLITDFIHKTFPFWKTTSHTYPIPNHLIFKKALPLPQNIFYKCHLIIKALWNLRQTPAYQAHVQKQTQVAHDPHHYAILMCYDFHVTEDDVKLIEVNTNASFGILAGLLSLKRKITPTFLPEYPKVLKDSLLEEIIRFGLKTSAVCIALMDDHPQQQKAYFEFEYYKALFEHWGYKTLICDPAELTWNPLKKVLQYKGQTVDFIYNRCCDFLFENPKNQHLRQAFLSHSTCFSPNPYEYSLLAHKERFIDISKKGFLEKCGLSKNQIQILQKAIPHSFSILDLSKEQIWSERKRLFFKPKKLYGSKGAFRGKSLSKNKLDSIYTLEFMAQEDIRPSVFEGYKYDLRIYTYKSDPHLAIARLYQGQVTNAHTPGGGLAPIHWIDS